MKEHEALWAEEHHAPGSYPWSLPLDGGASSVFTHPWERPDRVDDIDRNSADEGTELASGEGEVMELSYAWHNGTM